MKEVFIKIIILVILINCRVFGYCYSDICIKNEKNLSKETKNFLNLYKNKELNDSDLNEMMKGLHDIYAKQGEIISTVDIADESLEKEKLILYLKKAHINEIRGDKNYILSLPFTENQVLNIHKIDQLAENLKTTLSEPEILVIPSEKEGYYDIEIRTIRKKEFEGYVALDNNNYKDYGRENLFVSLGRDNLLLPGDFMTIGLKERLTKNRKNHKERSYSFSYSFPVKSWKLSYDFSHEETSDKILKGEYTSRKDENIHNFQISKIFYRNNVQKSELFLGMRMKDTKNYFNDIQLDVSSKRHNNAVAGIRTTYYIENGVIYFEPSIEKGIALFGGEGNEKNGETLYPFDKEFSKYNLNLYLTKNFFPTKLGYFNYTLNILGSYSEDNLLDANKFEMGGVDSVRGFKENTIKGDKGIYFSNTLTLERETLSPFIGLDFGISRDYYMENSDKLAGIAAGIKFNKGNLSGMLTFSKAVVRAKDMPKENNPVYFRVSYTF